MHVLVKKCHFLVSLKQLTVILTVVIAVSSGFMKRKKYYNE